MTLRPNENEGPPLSDRLTAYYRQIMATHADDPIVGACLICKVSRCEDWRAAAVRLIYSGGDRVEPVGLPDALTEDGLP